MIEIEQHGAVRELRLARPPVNALNPAMLGMIAECIDAAVAEDSRAIVLSGRPGVFTAGLDVPELLSLDRPSIFEFWRTFIGCLNTVATCPIPIAAAMTGHSPAGGTVLAILCDYRVAAAGAFKMGLNEVEVGLPLPAPIFKGYELIVGHRTAERLAVQGALVGPDEALRVGLVDEVWPVEEVVPAALGWANRITGMPPVAMRATRDRARQKLRDLFSDHEDWDYEALADVWLSNETQAAMSAMVERVSAKRRSG